MFAGRFVLDIWKSSEYAPVAALKNFYRFSRFFLLKCLQMKPIELLVLRNFLKYNVFAKQFSLLSLL